MTNIIDIVVQENQAFNDYKIDQCVISSKTFFKEVCDCKEKETIFETCSNIAFPYIFYPYTEDVKIKERAVFLKTNGATNNIDPSESIRTIQFKTDYHTDNVFQLFTEDDLVEEKYLQSTPPSFFILSKPNIGEIDLAKIIADQWKCLLITPQTVILEEIESGSRVGKCINFNLKNGRAVGPEVILRLAERRLKSEIAKHRGFVIAGFPLIPNDFYKEEPLSSESAVFNVEEIFEELLPVTEIPDRPDSTSTMKGSKLSLDATFEKSLLEEEEGQGEEHEPKSTKIFLPKKKLYSSDHDHFDLNQEHSGDIIKCTESFNLLSSLENQMVFLFDLFSSPMVMIYILCNNLDVLKKAHIYRFSLLLKDEICLQKDVTDIHPSATLDHTEFIDGNYLKNSVILPIYTKNSISTFLKHFNFKLHSFIERKVLDHDPQYFIKIDGRLSANKMFNAMRLRLKNLGLQNVLIPEKMDEIYAIAEDHEETANESVKETFLKLRNLNIVNPKYKWQLSHWGFKCPVALKKGKVVRGSSKCAVRFMNKIFFTSDNAALTSFCENPRRFLLPVKPKPPYRIIILGPKYSGKSYIAQCLSYLYNLPLLDPNYLEKEYLKVKEGKFYDKVKSIAITEALLELTKKRELDKEEKMKFWEKSILNLLKTAFPELKITQTMDSTSKRVIFVETTDDSRSDKSLASQMSERTHAEILAELEKMNFPMGDIVQIQNIIDDRTKLFKYLPEELLKPIEEPSVHDPFVTQYVDDILQNKVFEETDLNAQELTDMFQTAIKNIEETFGKHQGWIIDGFSPEINIFKEFSVEDLADSIICLKDENPENNFLLAKYSKNDNIVDTEFQKFFSDMQNCTDDLNFHSINEKTYNLICNLSITDSEDKIAEDIEIIKNNRDQKYADHLMEFDIKWLETNNYLTSVCCDPPIEINIANKSIPLVLKECISRIEDKYRQTATFFSEEDKFLEQRQWQMMETFGEDEELDEEEREYKDTIDKYIYGCTGIFCPVTFHDYFTLWKGKSEFQATFQNKIYCLSNENCLNKFIDNPYFYAVLKKHKLPPARICITGPLGSGRTTVAKALAKIFGLFYVDFEKAILDNLFLYSFVQLNDLILSEEINKYDFIKKYVEDKEYLLPDFILKKTLEPLWFNTPYQETGFILDNFPQKLEEIKYMIEHYLIPDLVIELKISKEETRDRLVPLRLNKWKEDILYKQQEKELQNALEIKIWEEEIKKHIEIMIEMLKEERKQEFLRTKPPVQPYSSPVDSSTILPQGIEEEIEEEEEIEINMFMYDPVQEEEDLKEIRKKVYEDYPAPTFNDIWETIEEAQERIEFMIEEIYDKNFQFLEGLKDGLTKHNIDYINFSSNVSPSTVLVNLSHLIEKFKFRNELIFENIQLITMDVAEKFLEQGAFFLGTCGRTCPVQAYNKSNPVQMFLASEHKMIISPVIHRRCIYFLYGNDHLNKFKQNPLIYTQNEDCHFPLLPIKIAIIGSPKCGKSVLADKFQKEFGLKLITRGQAIRYVLKYLPNSALAENIMTVLEKGWSLTSEMIASAVEALTLDGKCITQGYVLDGFPTSMIEMKFLRDLGIIPYVIINLFADENKVIECTLNDSGKRNMPPFSEKFIKIRYKYWQDESFKLHDRLHYEFQNIYTFENLNNRWCIWEKAKSIACSNFSNILNHFINRYKNLVFPLKSLLISPFEFSEKQGYYKNLCPCCLFYDNKLEQGGTPPDRNGLVQYLEYYYWICQKHLDMFMKNPLYYLSPKIETLLSQLLPEVVKNYNGDTYQDGLCIVTFWDNQPKRVLQFGTRAHVVFYKDKYYSFCSEICLEKFMKYPHLYFNKIIHFRDPFPLQLQENLPQLGYLEQYVSKQIICALLNTEFSRPVHPCMDIKTSAAINIGLYLKTNNPKANVKYLQINNNFKNKFKERVELLKLLVSNFNRKPNPFCEMKQSIHI